MLLFHADDYGINVSQAERILSLWENGCLNSMSILVNSPEAAPCSNILPREFHCRLHLNFREGPCLCDPAKIPLLVNKKGYFCLSFLGLFFFSLFRRRELMLELMEETDLQLTRFYELMGEDYPLRMDSHGHYHMIPVVWDAFFETCKKRGVTVEEIRIPAEPLRPFFEHAGILWQVPFSGVLKNALMHVLYVRNRILGHHPRDFDFQKRAPLFFGMTFTTRMFEPRVRRLLPSFLRLARGEGRDLELMFHPGYLGGEEELWDEGFASFHLSEDRKKEGQTILSLKEKSWMEGRQEERR